MYVAYSSLSLYIYIHTISNTESAEDIFYIHREINLPMYIIIK
jgi:hypothetical protein